MSFFNGVSFVLCLYTDTTEDEPSVILSRFISSFVWKQFPINDFDSIISDVFNLCWLLETILWISTWRVVYKCNRKQLEKLSQNNYISSCSINCRGVHGDKALMALDISSPEFKYKYLVIYGVISISLGRKFVNLPILHFKTFEWYNWSIKFLAFFGTALTGVISAF